MKFPKANAALIIVALPVVCLLAYAILHRGAGPESSERPPGRPAESLPAQSDPPRAAAILPAPRAQDRNPDLQGDPEAIRKIIEDLDRKGKGDPSAYGSLTPRIREIINGNRIHALPLVSRILCDPTAPGELRQAALDALLTSPTAQSADLLGRLVIGNSAVSSALPGILETLGKIVGQLLPVNITPPLRTICLQAAEAGLSSENPETRRAALAGYLALCDPKDPVVVAQTCFTVFSSDPSPEVRREAYLILIRRPECSAGNLWLADQMNRLVQSDDAETRAMALRVLVATDTELARATVLREMSSSSKELRDLAVSAAGTLKLAAAVPRLAAILSDAKTYDLTTRQSCALDALAKIPGLDSARVLANSAAADPEPGIRQAALKHLIHSETARDPALGADLIAIFRASRDEESSGDLLLLLAKNASRETYGVLQAEYASADVDRRLDVASALLQSAHSTEFILGAFPDLIGTELGAESVKALAEAAPERAIKDLRKLYVDEKGGALSTRTRRSAIQALGAIGSKSAGELLSKIQAIEPDPNLQNTIQDALDQVSRKE